MNPCSHEFSYISQDGNKVTVGPTNPRGQALAKWCSRCGMIAILGVGILVPTLAVERVEPTPEP
jgi:hypothetical protein